MNEWVKTEETIPGYYDELREMTIPTRTVTYWHTRECIEYGKARRAAAAEYESKWPNYCKKCGGVQGSSYYENQSPYGSGECWMMEMFEPCDACWGKCPRCGADLESVLPDSLIIEEVLRQLDKDVALGKQNGYHFQTYYMEYLDKVEIWNEQDLPCPVCGWNRGKGKDDYHPGGEEECYCWEREDYPPKVQEREEWEQHFRHADDWLEQAYEDRTYIEEE